MPDWDPYYLARGMRRALPEERTEAGHWLRLQRAEAADEKKRERAEDRAELADQAASAVSVRQVTAFRQKLDLYDAANTQDLLLNSENLAKARAMLASILARAYVHSDGRRLFRTRDGTQVFDEFGEDMTDEVDPDLIEEGRPTWEDYLPSLEAKSALEAERDGLIERQGRIDAARDRIDDEDLTVDELDALDADLGAPIRIPITPTGETKSEQRSAPAVQTHQQTRDFGPMPQ